MILVRFIRCIQTKHKIDKVGKEVAFCNAMRGVKRMKDFLTHLYKLLQIGASVVETDEGHVQCNTKEYTLHINFSSLLSCFMDDALSKTDQIYRSLISQEESPFYLCVRCC